MCIVYPLLVAGRDGKVTGIVRLADGRWFRWYARLGSARRRTKGGRPCIDGAAVLVVGKARLGTANEEWGGSCSTRVQKIGWWPGGGQSKAREVGHA